MLIRVINGTVGYRPRDEHGNLSLSVTEKRRGDAPFEVDDETAERLILAGAAVPAGEAPLPQAAAALPDGAEDGQGIYPSEPEPPAEGPEDAPEEALEEMTVAQLKILAADLGADVSGCRRKQELIDRIREAQADTVEDGEAPPELAAEGPVV